MPCLEYDYNLLTFTKRTLIPLLHVIPVKWIMTSTEPKVIPAGIEMKGIDILDVPTVGMWMTFRLYLYPSRSRLGGSSAYGCMLAIKHSPIIEHAIPDGDEFGARLLPSMFALRIPYQCEFSSEPEAFRKIAFHLCNDPIHLDSFFIIHSFPYAIWLWALLTWILGMILWGMMYDFGLVWYICFGFPQLLAF